MARLEARVAATGRRTVNIGYASLRHPIADLAEQVAVQLRDEVPEGPLLAVTHSMGGILLRHLSDQFDWRGCVMLGPPNQSSDLARLAQRVPILRWIAGPACRDLAGKPAWPDPPKPCGLIVGTSGVTWANPPAWLGKIGGVFGPDDVHDGTVSIAEVMHDAATDVALVRTGHTVMMNHPDVVNLVLRFLDTGDFGTTAKDPSIETDTSRAELATG
ncbi:MAG: hypothetical protein MK077_06890 [Phycisphaerales bacterium]|nr:hypothetical protein [Phycisphaerales bacterium]